MGDNWLLWWSLLLCLFCLDKGGVGTSSILGGIGHDALATNKFVKTGIVFGHGVSSLVVGAVNVVAVVGCCAIGGLP